MGAIVGLVAVAIYSVALLAAIDPGRGFGPRSGMQLAALSFLGALPCPAVLAATGWIAWGYPHVSVRIAWLAVAAGAFIGIPLAAVVTVLSPVIALPFGGVLVLPVAIGASEEFAKALAVVWLSRERRPAAGLSGLFAGLLCGLGFAAVENVAYIASGAIHGGVRSALEIAGARALTTPMHGLWSASLCAMVWRERRVTLQLTAPVIVTYLAVSILHAIWNFALVAETEAQAAAGIVVGAVCTLGVFILSARAAARSRSGKE